MKDTLKKLKKRKIISSILIVVLLVFAVGLFGILRPTIKNIKIDKIVSKTTSLNASVIDGISEGVTSNNYDEIKYKLKVNKESADTAVIIGLLTDRENKFARFKNTKGTTVTDNGKRIEIRTTKDRVNVTVIVENAPYGETIKPTFNINSEDQSKSEINVDTVTITGKSVEGQVKNENGASIEGVELALIKNNEEVKRTFAKENGNYVFSLGDTENYEISLVEENYKLVRFEDASTDENRRILNIVVKEVEPLNLNVKKTISKLDLIINGQKQSFDYDDATEVVRSVKNAKTIEGSIYYNISIKNEGEVKGTLTVLRDVLPKGLSFDKDKNPGWNKEGNNLLYTPLEGQEIESYERKSATLVLDIEKTEEAKTYINSATSKTEDYEYVVYYLNNNIFKEEYVLNSEKIEDINPGVENFDGWYTDRKYTNKFDFSKEITKDTILFGKINNNKYTVTYVDKNPNTNSETILDTKEVDEGAVAEIIEHPEYRGYTYKCFKLNDACYNNEEIFEDTTLYTSYTLNEYDIDYDLDGGHLETGESNPTTYTVKDEITLKNPSKLGYTFLGWTGDDLTEYTIDVTIPAGSIGDREYKANFKINSYTLTVDPNGGLYNGSSDNVDLVNDYGTIIALDNPTKLGYTFNSWSLTGIGSLSGSSYTYGLGNGKVVANYSPVTYQIDYELNGGTPSGTNPTSYNIETETITLNNPSKEGYTFKGWTGSNGDEPELTVTIPTGSTGNKSYVANFEINKSNLTVDPNGGIYENSPIATIYRQDYGTIKAITASEKTGYTFTGYTKTGGGIYQNNIYTFNNDDGVLTANYEIITYNITYENITEEERNSLNNPINYNVETEDFTLREPATRLDNQGNPSEDFLGWDDGNGNVSKNVTIEKGSIGDRTYTAVWRENQNEYAITYELNGGDLEQGKTNPNTYTRGTNTFTLNNPSKEGYTFKGWTGSNGNTPEKTVTIEKGSAGDKSYVANYEAITYNISYTGLTESEMTNLNNPRTYTIESETITLKNPTRTGYTFEGWTGSNGDEPSKPVVIPHGTIGDKEYSVNFEPISYPITYELDGGTPGGTNPASYTIESEAIILKNPSKTGYTFTGWTGSNGNVPEISVTIPSGSINEKHYVAHYTPIVYNITYHLNDGTLVTNNPSTYTIESETILLNNPSKVGYEFTGWTGSNGTSPQTSVTIPKGSTGDKEYTANFGEISYSITYTLNGGKLEEGKTNPTNYNINTPNITLNNPSKKGYTFKGWTGTDVDEPETNVTILTGSTGHRSYLANYEPIEYNITYDYDGGNLETGVTNPSKYTIETPEIIFNEPSKEGHNFLHYVNTETSVTTTSIPTGSTGDVSLKAIYEVKRYDVRYHNEESLYWVDSNVAWNTTTTAPQTNPTKAHNIFLYWSEDGVNAFDFSTLISEDRDLYAVYEEVLPPIITISPELNNETNRTWVCANTNNADCGDTITITSSHPDYDLYYKIGDSEAVLYTEPFKVYENVTISAFSKKNNIYSSETSKNVVNVDNIGPTINNPGIGAMSFNMTVSGTAQDAGSGVKKFTLYAKEKTALIFDDNLTYESEIFDGIRDHAENYDHTFYGVEENTTYTVLIRAEDYVGNITEREVEVATHPYVARVVGKNGILWYTVNPDTKEFEIDEGKEFLLFDSIQDAVNYCAEIQCTIQTNPIIPVVNESVTIGANQDITIDLDGRGIVSDESATFINNGKLQIVDRNPRMDSSDHESIGFVNNTTSKAIINNNIFILGDGSSEPGATFIFPELDRPIIEGKTNAIEQNNKFHFYDGKLISEETVIVDNGDDAITQYSYNVILSGEDDKNYATLERVSDPEARIRSTYYAKLKSTNLNAFDSSRTGTMTTESSMLLSKIKQVGDYGFVYDSVNDEIYNGNTTTVNTTALSYLKLDLTNETEDKIISFTAFIDTNSSNSTGYVSVSETLDNTGTIIFKQQGNNASSTRIHVLEKGKVYYIFFKFAKGGSNLNPSEIFKISNFRILGEREETNNILVNNDIDRYGFTKNDNGKIESNTGDARRVTAHAYIAYDLREETEDINVMINLDASIDNSESRAWIYTSDSIDFQNYDVTTNRVYYTAGRETGVTKNIKLTHGIINYVHFGFYNGWEYGKFSINSISYSKSKTDDLLPTSTLEHNSSDTYYFERISYDEWYDLVNNKTVRLNGSVENNNETGYSFDNNDYGIIAGEIVNSSLGTESVELEYSTLSSANQVIYSGGNNQNITIGTYDGYLIVSNKNAYTYDIPDDFDDGNKHKITVTYDSNGYNAYFDGIELPKREDTNYFSSEGNVYIARSKNGYYFTGTIYSIKDYNRVLTSEEISGTASSDGLILNLIANESNKKTITMYTSNNPVSSEATSHSYLTYDLTNVNEDKYLYVNTKISSSAGDDFGYVQVNESPNMPSDAVGRGLYISGIADNQSAILKLKKNTVNYVHFMFSKKYWTNNGDNKFYIKEIKYCNTISDAYSISPTNYSNINNYYFEKPVLNNEVDTIEILKNINLTAAIVVPQEKEVELDLNGFTITSEDEDYIIKNNGKLTIKDSEYAERHESNINYKLEQARLFELAKEEYLEDLAEYKEYMGLCDGCEPSEEYVLDHLDRDFSYSGETEEYPVLYGGTYKLQVWGAQGGYRTTSANGGKGGYSEGIIELNANETLYVTVGGSGNTGGPSGGFNGGGSKTTYPGGGGATDMRIEGDTLYHRIIVAGGGGSDGAANKPGKAGGGTSGVSAYESYGSGGAGGTQTAGGAHRGTFGQGGLGVFMNEGSGGGGFGGAGGGGWYGGGGVNPDRSDDDRGGGGGSGFVYDGTNTVPEDYAVTKHVLTNATTIAGTSNTIPTHDGTSTMTGNAGDGFAKITLIESAEREAARENLSKKYNIKEEPVFADYLDGIDFDSSVDINNIDIDSEVSYNNEVSDSHVGSIYSTITHTLLNEQYATLVLDGGAINVNVNSKAAIHNRGNLIIKGNTEINANNSSTIGVFNESNGNVQATGGVINANGGSTFGLLNRSNTSEISGLKIVTASTSAMGVRNEAIADVLYDNLSVSGSGVGFSEVSAGNTSITDSNFKSTGNDAFVSSYSSNPVKLNISSSNFSGTFSLVYSPRIVVVDNSNLSSIYNSYGNLIVNNSNFRNIDNRGTTLINDSTLTNSGTLVYNYGQTNHGGSSGTDLNGNLRIKNSTLNSTSTSAITVINNSNDLIISDTTFNNINNVKSTAITNSSSSGSGAYLTITGNTQIPSSFGTAINNTGVVTIGTSDKNIEQVYEYGYSGKQEEFTAPETGLYKLETWGASGSPYYVSNSYGFLYSGGYGAYASGVVSLSKGDKLYIHVGEFGSNGNNGNGSSNFGSYNGGGNNYDNRPDWNYQGSGGGATDISLSNEDNTWSYDNGISTSRRSAASYSQRIVVAGGGGSLFVDGYGGYNVDPSSSRLGYGDPASGGGYYGGTSRHGGSSYVSSDLTNAVMKNGNEEMPNYTSSGLIKGNFGNGYAKITLLNNENETVSQAPMIAATDYGIKGTGRVIYLDGTINAKVAVHGDIEKTEDDYDIYNTIDGNSNEKMILVANSDSRPVLTGEEEFVAAIGNAKYTTIQNAIDASNNGDEIDLLVNIEQQNTIEVPSNKQITIDYNGHIVKSYNNNYLYNNLGNLTITDSTNTLGKNTFTGDKYIYNEGTLNISKIYIDNFDYSTNIIENKDGIVVMDGVRLDFGSNSISDKNAITNTETGSITVKNSTINLTGNNNIINNNGSLTLKDNTISSANGNTIVKNNSTGTVTLDGNSYSVSSSDSYGRYLLNNAGEATVKNMTTTIEDITSYGKLTLEDNNIPSGYLASSGLLIINNGTYSNNITISGSGKKIDNTEDLYSLIMHDGTLNKVLTRNSTGITNIESGTITVTSGYAISNSSSGVINLGIKDGHAESKQNTKPVITGKTYGIYTSNPSLVVNFYDGIVSGQKAYNVTIEDIETGYSLLREYDSTNDIETKYLSDEPMFTNDTKHIDYNSIAELNDAITNNLVDNNDVIKVYRNITIIKNDTAITIPSGLKITFDINGKIVDKNNNTMFIINGEVDAIDSVSNSEGKISSTLGTVFENNGTLNINSGTYTSEQASIESNIIKNNTNGKLNISGGTFTKYYDNLGYRKTKSGEIINNNGEVDVTGGKFYANAAFCEGWFDYVDNMFTSAIFVNSETGVIDVTGGIFDGIPHTKAYSGRYGNWSDTSIKAKGELIYNDGIATFTGITSYNSHIGKNNNELTMINVTMPDIISINKSHNYGSPGSIPNLYNTGDLTLVDSTFTTQASFFDNNGGNVTIERTTINRTANGNTYHAGEDDLGYQGYKNSHVIRNYNKKNDCEVNIIDSNIYNRGSGETIDNRGNMNISGSTIEASTNNAINVSSATLSVSNSDVTAKNIAISLAGSTADITDNSSIISTSVQAINISNSTVNIGEPIADDGEVSKTYPIIKGETNGIDNSGTLNFYDGIIMGKSIQVSGVINNIEPGYLNIEDTDNGYKTTYLDRVPVIQNITKATQSDEKKYYDLKTAFEEATDGDTLKMISNYSNLPTDLTAVNNNNITFDLNGKFIRQCNDLLITNNGSINLIDNSQDKTGEIIGISGSKVIDNYGTINFTSGKISSNSIRLIIKNNTGSTLTIRDEAKIVVPIISTLIDNSGTVNIYNGAYLQNRHGEVDSFLNRTNTGLPMIINRDTLNIIDFENDDDSLTTSSYPAPRLYCVGNANIGELWYWSTVPYVDSVIRNVSGATATIYGGVYNNGNNSSPDGGKIIYNSGTAIMRNMDNYSFMVGYNDGSLTIENSVFHNFQAGGLISLSGTLNIKDTTINFYQTGYAQSIVGNSIVMRLGNATLDNVTMTEGQNSVYGYDLTILSVEGQTEIKNSSISFGAYINSIYNNSTLTIKDTPINITQKIRNEGTLIIKNSNVTATNTTGISNANKLTLDNSDITVTNGVALSNSGTVTLDNDISISTTSGNAVNNTGNINIPIGTTITSQSGYGIYLNENGKINLGELGNTPDVTSPYIEGSTFGIYRDSRTSELNYYDGLIIGGTGTNAIYGGVTDIESGYETENILDPNDNKYHEYLVPSASVVAVATVGNYTFASNNSVSPSRALQNAINHAIGDGTSVKDVNLQSNVDLVNDGFSLTASMAVTINLNGHTILTDSTHTVDSNINLNSSSLGASVSKLLSDVFDVNNNSKNIIIYELSDGSILDTTKTYKLYKNGNLLSLEKEEFGRYKAEGDNELLIPIKGRLYIDNLYEGTYKLESSDNKYIEFSIDSNGNISGNVVANNNPDDSSSATSTAFAKLILTHQTGKDKHYYWLLIIPIIITITILMLITRRKKREI